MLNGKKKIFVYGFGKSGKACVDFLLEWGHTIVFYGDNTLDENMKSDYIQNGVLVKEKMWNESDLDEVDYLVKSPGIPKENKLVLKAKELGIKIITDIELVYLIRPHLKYIAVTGTNGKTTTTSLIGDLLQAYKKSVYVCGNIGTPVCEVAKYAQDGEIMIVELSSFQLEYTHTFQPDITVISNIGTAHIDYHGSLEQYYEDKFRFLKNLDETKKIFMHKKDYDKVDKYLNGANVSLLEIDTESKIIQYNNKELVDRDRFKLIGGHNVRNLNLALKVAEDFDIDKKDVIDVIVNFKSVAYRLEFLGKIYNVDVYNDAKSTNPQSLITALKSVKKSVLLITGGYDRGDDYHCIKEYLNCVKKIVAYGETAEKIEVIAKEENIECINAKNLKSAFVIAKEILSKNNIDILLYSPGAASYDQFKNYLERGKLFTELYCINSN